MSDVPGLQSDLGPLARLEDVKRDVGAPGEVFRLLTDPDDPRTLQQIAKEWRLPGGRFVEWFTLTHAQRYDAALKVRADNLAHGALAIADEQNEVLKRDGGTFDPDVPRDKLRVDTRLKLAGKWDRARYGEHVKVERELALVVDAGLLGTIGDLLKVARGGRAPALIEGEKVADQVEPEPPAVNYI